MLKYTYKTEKCLLLNDCHNYAAESKPYFRQPLTLSLYINISVYIPVYVQLEDKKTYCPPKGKPLGF